MKVLLPLLAALLLCACEKKPTPEEIEQKKEEARFRATPTPRPPLNDLKNYKNPLEQKR